MIVSGTKLSMVRGDAESIRITCTKDSVKQNLVTGDTIYFTVKEDIKKTEFVLQKIITSFTDGVAYVYIYPDDTKDLTRSKYIYDVQLNLSNGTVKTIVRPSDFIIEAGVTDD